MNNKAKYIIFEHTGPVIFSLHVDHIEMKRLIREEPVSAGFVQVAVLKGEAVVYCYGKSVTLGIGSKEEDSLQLKKMLGI